ncbi:hypothetical protein AURDEDRAFT_165157 [Auricularia subglabra TFB-10046 SS5]|nr:hypothetical protein AURDEDRAFT_165157 [Auricularia subglabra TFB-10046 SS5]
MDATLANNFFVPIASDSPSTQASGDVAASPAIAVIDAVTDAPSVTPVPQVAEPARAADVQTEANGLETNTRVPVPFDSPTASMFEEAGFTPVPKAGKTRKFPGTPSDNAVRAERKENRASEIGMLDHALAAGSKKNFSRVFSDTEDDGVTAHTSLNNLGGWPPLPSNGKGKKKAPKPFVSRWARPASPAGGATSHAGPTRLPPRSEPEEIHQFASPPTPALPSTSASVVKQEPSSAVSYRPVFPPDGDDEGEDSPTEDLRRRLRPRANATSLHVRPPRPREHVAPPAPHAADQRRLDNDGDDDDDDIVEVEAPRFPADEPMEVSDSEYEYAEVFDIEDSDSEWACIEAPNGGIKVEHPLPSEEQTDRMIEQFGKILAKCKLVFAAVGDISLPIDGQPANAIWKYVCAKQQKAVDEVPGDKQVITILDIKGIGPLSEQDDATVDAFVNKLLVTMYPENSDKYQAIRLKARLSAGPDEQVRKHSYVLVRMPTRRLAPFRSGRFISAGLALIQSHEYREDASPYLCAYEGLTSSKRCALRDIKGTLRQTPGVVAVANRHAQLKKISPEDSLDMLIDTIRIEETVAVKPKTPGVMTRQLHTRGGDHLQAELFARLATAARNAIIETQLYGRGIAWNGWNCIICRSISHPTGMCPARMLEGWAEVIDRAIARARDDRRNKGNAAVGGQGPSNKAPTFNNQRRGQGQKA